MSNIDISSQSTIRSLIERSFVFAMASILLITTIVSLYLNQSNLQDRRASNLQKIHEILSNFITPALMISDVTEMRRLLQLASGNDETFVVIDNNKSILMPDYEKISLVKSVINVKTGLVDCDHLHTIYKRINGDGYWVNCTLLTRQDMLSNGERLGMLISFSANKWLFFSPMMLYLIGIAIFSLLLITVWFRQILHRKLLRPLVILEAQIANKATSPLSVDTKIDDIGNAPFEVIAIKSGFEALLINLQAEYKRRVESEKNAALFDLAARVAHDIRSPLAVMEMTLSSVSKTIPDEDAVIQREAIQSVRNIANDLLQRYREPVVDLHHLEHIQPSSICFNELIERLIVQKQQEWMANPCDITFSTLPSAKSINVMAASDDVKRMISNLLNNAYEALHNERCIKVLLNLVDDMLVLDIYDTGIGIPDSKISAALAGESTKHGGKGLGLSGAKGYMEGLGGTLQVTSALGIGTHVILSFRVYKDSMF